MSTFTERMCVLTTIPAVYRRRLTEEKRERERVTEMDQVELREGE